MLFEPQQLHQDINQANRHVQNLDGNAARAVTGMWVASSGSLRCTIPDSGCTGPLSDTVDGRQTWSLAFPFSRFVDILKCCTDTSQIEIFRIGQRIAKLSMERISALSSIQISSPPTSPRFYETVSPAQPNPINLCKPSTNSVLYLMGKPNSTWSLCGTLF